MKHYDNHEIENKLNEAGYNLICGTDEAGRGPLAGPVVIAACIMPNKLEIEGVTDSKKVSEKNRYILEKEIKEKAISYSIIFIDEKKIDEINILEASRLGMEQAILDLNIKPDYILTDAMNIKTDIPYEAIIKGDAKSFTIACASILAKCARDRYMDLLDNEYPEYGFKKHKGYPTKAHMEALKTYGVTSVHRASYGPVKKELDLKNYYQKKKNKRKE